MALHRVRVQEGRIWLEPEKHGLVDARVGHISISQSSGDSHWHVESSNLHNHLRQISQQSVEVKYSMVVEKREVK